MEKVLLNFLLDLNEQGLINNHDFDYEKVARAFANKDENKQLIIADVIGSKITQPYYIEVKIVTGGVLATNANFEIIKDFEKHGFTFKDEPITQINDDGIAWTFMMKNGGLLEG